MIHFKHSAAEYLAAGCMNEAIGLHSFINDNVFLTKSGDVGVILALPGIDFEGQTHEHLDSLARRFEAACRSFGEQHEVYQYLMKTAAPTIEHSIHPNEIINQAISSRVAHFYEKADGLFTVQVYMAVTYKAWTTTEGFAQKLSEIKEHPINALRAALRRDKPITILASQLQEAVTTLLHSVRSFTTAAEDFQPALLDKFAAFRFFRRLLNYTPHKHEYAQLPSDDLLDYYVCDSYLETHRRYLRQDDYFVQVLSLKELPTSTFANTFAELMRIPSNAIVCTQFRRIPNTKALRVIRSKQRHFHNGRTSFLATAMAGDNPQPGELIVDQASTALVDDLGACTKEIEFHGNYFGEFTFTLILYSKNPQDLATSVAEANKIFATKDALLINETYNACGAYLSVIPGNSIYNVRQLLITATNYADISFLFTVSTGHPRNAHLNAEYLALLETQHSTPYYFNLHYRDVAHTLITGATGSGKSFLLNFLLTNAQKYTPRTFIFDLGGSYKSLTTLFGGTYSKVGFDHAAFAINPFSLPPTPDNREFLFAFIRVLLENESDHKVSDEDAKEIFEAIGNVYQLPEEQRRFLSLSTLLPRAIAVRLARWVQGGQYASLFDNQQDTLTFAEFQCFDFEGLDKYPTILEPLLFYVLHRANAIVYDPTIKSALKMFVMDEAWRFFQNETIRNYLREALKTWRKHNGAMIMATQSGDDLRQSNILELVLESCPTRIFLANPGLNVAAYREMFQLNETQTDLVRTLRPKSQMFLHTPELSKILTLEVDPRSYWLYTNSPNDNAKRDQLVTAHGLTKALDILAGKARS